MPKVSPPAPPAAPGDGTGASAADRSAHSTDHLLTDLKGRTVRGGAVTLAAQAAKLLATLVSTYILARLLEPSDFGKVAMVTAFTGIIALFKDAGLSLATIQKKDLSDAQVSTLFWINVVVAVFLFAVAATVAPWIAAFYGSPDLEPIAVTLGATLVFAGASAQHHALLRRQMRYGRLGALDVAALVVGVVVGITCALFGLGAWSLVWMQMANAVATCVGAWVLCSWRPGAPAPLRDVKDLVGFGAHLTGAGALNYAARNTDKLLLGRFFGDVIVGFYVKAYKLMMLPLNMVNAPLSSVAIPALSPIAHDADRYREALLRTMEKAVVITMLLAAFLVGAADWIVLALLGPKWIAAGPLLSLLGVAAFAQPISNAASWCLVSQGRAREIMRLSAIDTVIVVVAIVAGLPFGVAGVAASYALASIAVRVPLQLFVVGRRGPVSLRDLWTTCAPGLVASGVALAALGAFRLAGLSLHVWVLLVLAGLVWLAGGALGLAVTPRGRAAWRDLYGALPALTATRRQP
ncbi:MAG: lipopolysaccharide biosynthesis protein [Planctomycetota bacterium]|nr:lipopolysaccharide biosynthesis protein [Planctomycetota bacterium]